MTLCLTALHYHANELLPCLASPVLVYSSAFSTYLYHIRTSNTPSYKRHRDGNPQLWPITLHNSPHHMPPRTLHRATALFPPPTQLRSCTMMNPWLTAGEWKTTVLGEYAPQTTNWLPYTPPPCEKWLADSVMALVTLLILSTPYQRKTHTYICPPYAITRYKLQGVPNSSRFQKVMTSTIRKKNTVAILPLSRALNADPRAAQAEAKKSEDDGITKTLAVINPKHGFRKLYPFRTDITGRLRNDYLHCHRYMRNTCSFLYP